MSYEKYEPQAGIPVTIDLVRDMVQNYRSRQYSEMGQDDSRYAWFSISELIHCLSQMQHLNKANGCRIYFGAVTQEVINSSTRSDRQEYLNKLTMIFVPTRTRKEGNDEYEDDIMDGDVRAYDFGTLCPPGINHDPVDYNKSIHKQVYFI